MKAFWEHNKFVLLCFALALGLVFLFYSDVLLAPNSYLFSPTGDGLKNYFTYMFHAKHNVGFWEFSGMNYPFGENIVYTDAHPLLSYLIGVFGLTHYGVGILNLLMILSIPLTAYIMYKIFRHFNVSIPWAICAGIAISLMSPQIQRMTGHLAMAYGFAIPLVWLMLIKFRTQNKLKWSCFIGIFVFVFFFTHPYLGMIMISFVFAFFLVRIISEKGERIKELFYFLIQAIIPLISFRLLLLMNDSHLNRTGDPAGFFQYYASWKSIFVPFFGPLSKVKNWLGINTGNWESWNYVGFSTIIFSIILLTYIVRKHQTLPFKAFLKTDLAKYMIAASLVLTFAFCFPLKYSWAKWVTEYFGALKQFRVLGRFGWVFFYVFIAFITILFYRFKQKSNYKSAINIVFYAGFVFTLFEAYPVHKMVSENITKTPNYFKIESVDEEMKELISFTKEGNYDAIMFLPFTHLSSENIMLLGTEESNKDAFLVSYHSGTPLMNSMSSRMSIDESVLFNNFFGPEYVYKELEQYLPENSKILLVKNDESLHQRELSLVWTQDKIYTSEKYKAYTFDLSRYNNRKYYDSLMVKREKSEEKNPDYFKTFEIDNEFTFSGKGSLKGTKNSWFVFDTIQKSDLPPGDYTASLWYYLGVNRPDMVFNCEYIYPDSNIIITETDIKQSTHIIDNWCYIELNFTFLEEINQIRFSIIGNDSGEPFYIDEFQIIQRGKHVFKEELRGKKRYIIYNNHRVPVYDDI